MQPVGALRAQAGKLALFPLIAVRALYTGLLDTAHSISSGAYHFSARIKSDQVIAGRQLFVHTFRPPSTRLIFCFYFEKKNGAMSRIKKGEKNLKVGGGV